MPAHAGEILILKVTLKVCRVSFLKKLCFYDDIRISHVHFIIMEGRIVPAVENTPVSFRRKPDSRAETSAQTQTQKLHMKRLFQVPEGDCQKFFLFSFFTKVVFVAYRWMYSSEILRCNKVMTIWHLTFHQNSKNIYTCAQWGGKCYALLNFVVYFTPWKPSTFRNVPKYFIKIATYWLSI